MNYKNLFLMILALLVLGGIFWATQPGSGNEGQKKSASLFGDIAAEKIARISLKQAESAFDLELKDGRWTVPSRANYPADYGTVKALMLKVLGLEVSQLISIDETNFKDLGVTDEDVEKGRGFISFHTQEGKQLAGIFLGSFRKKKHASGVPARTGQYVRRSDQNKVYLIGDPITAVTTLTHWLETSLANVLQKQIESISQQSFDSDRSSEEFLLSRTGDEEKEKPLSVFSNIELKQGEEFSQMTLSQVRSGLEGLRMNDVMAADAEQAADLTFNFNTVYQLSNGLEYAVTTAEKDDKHFAKIKVRFDADLAASLKARAQEMASDDSKEEPASADVAEEAAKVEKKPELELSSEEEATKLMAQYEPWVFELPKYIGRKFRHTRGTLVQQEKAPAPPAGSE